MSESATNISQSVAGSSVAKKEKTPRYAWVILLVTYLCSFAAPLAQFKVVTIADWIIPYYGLNYASFGVLMTSVSIIGVILAFPAAFICRKMGLKWTIVLAVGGVAVGGILQLLTPSIAVLNIGRFIEGIGIGIAGVAAPTLISLWFPDKTRGLALGLWCTWVPASITLDYNIDPMLAINFGWQSVFWFCIIFAIVAMILFLIFFKLPEGDTASYAVEGNFKDCFKYLKNKYIWLLGFSFLVYIIGQTGIVNTYFAQFLETTSWKFDVVTASSMMSVITAIGFISNPLAGTIAGRLPRNKKYLVVATLFVLYLISFPLCFSEGNIAILWIGIVVMGICAGIGGGGTRPIAPSIMNASAMAVTMGMSVIQFAQCLGNCFSPVYGALIDRGVGWFDACLYSIIPLSIIALILSFFIKPDEEEKARKKAARVAKAQSAKL